MTSRGQIVMIVDDDESIRDYVRMILELELGVKTIVAEDGDQALALLSEPLPTFILTDVRMPRLDGTELIRKLRAWPATCRIPITVMAASVSSREAAMAEGASDYLDKPFDSERLLQMTRQHLTQEEISAA